MPICKHLKPVGDCAECRPRETLIDKLGDRSTFTKTPVLTQAIVDKVAATLVKAEKAPKPKFGLVRDVVQKINGKAKPKGRKR